MIQKHACWARILRASLLYDYFVYFDCENHLSYEVFSVVCPHTKIHTQEYVNKKYKYHMLLSRVAKKDSKRFRDALELIPTKMLANGFDDYVETCKAILAECETSGAGESERLYKNKRSAKK